MELGELKNIIPEEFADNSRVWIYQSSRPFVEKEEKEINEQLYQFYVQWQSHGTPVKGWAKLLFGQFVIIIADENDFRVSGCSTDSSVRVIKSIERQYSVNMFDRMLLTFYVKGKAQMLPFNQLQFAVERGYITRDTLMFNNVVETKADIFTKWIVPVEHTWLRNRIAFPEPQKGK